MVIVGIDPGLAHTGWGVITSDGRSWRACAYGCIDTRSDQSMAERLHIIYEGVCDVLIRYHATHAAVEDVFSSTNVRTAFSLGQARGSALLACSLCDGVVGEYSPNTIKQHIVGHGHADKDQVSYMVQMLLGLDHVPQPDHCSDALAIALTHGFSLTRDERLKEVCAS